jgi:nucleoside-diphosphate-sugar epimerase
MPMVTEKRVTLVTGASGFMGSRLCERLQRERAYVIAVGRQAKKGPWDEFREADLSSGWIEEDLCRGADIVFHLAGKAHEVSGRGGEEAEYEPVIVEGTRSLVDVAQRNGVETFVYVSSVKAMGDGNPVGLPLEPMDESWPYTPQSAYGATKIKAEAIVHESGFAHAVVLRPTIVYGPGDKGNLPRMVEAVRRGSFPPMPDTGNRRSMIFIDDVVEYLFRAATMPVAAGKTYIVTGPDAPGTRALCDAIREGIGMPPPVVSLPHALLRVVATLGSFRSFIFRRRLPLDLATLQELRASAWYSGEKARRELAYEPKQSVLDWLRAAGTPFPGKREAASDRF